MRIPPKYTLNPKITKLLSQIEAYRIFFSSIDINKQVKNRIERVSLLKSSLFSARIEGNPLTLNNFENTNDVLKKREVSNIIRALSFIKNKVRVKYSVDADSILKIHAYVMQGLSPTAGRFRSEVSAIFNSAGVAVYMPPPPSQIRKFMQQLFTYINSGKEPNALICALTSHLIFEKIHPFLDGNGRVGRLLIYIITKARNWEFPLFTPIEEYIDEHKESYYYFLDIGLKDINAYLEFMLEAFLDSAEKLKREILDTSASHTKMLLTPRQEEIYLILKDHGTVSFDFIHRHFLKVPARTLRYDLKKLQDKKLISKIGRTRGAFYKILK